MKLINPPDLWPHCTRAVKDNKFRHCYLLLDTFCCHNTTHIAWKTNLNVFTLVYRLLMRGSVVNRKLTNDFSYYSCSFCCLNNADWRFGTYNLVSWIITYVIDSIQIILNQCWKSSFNWFRFEIYRRLNIYKKRKFSVISRKRSYRL